MSTQKPGNSTVPTKPTDPAPVTFRPPGDSTGKGNGSGAVEKPVNGVEQDILKPR